MPENNNEQLHDILKKELEPKFTEYFNRGLMAGYDAAIGQMYKEIMGFTSANQIKKHMKHRMDEVKKRQSNE